MTVRLHTITYCGDDECPSRGAVQHRNKDGETERHPFCYQKVRQIPETIGEDGYEDFPDWCPLEVRP